MDNYIVVIPSYRRPSIIKSHTIAYLKECGIPNNMIHVFIVDDEEEVATYQESLRGHTGIHIHKGPLGLHNMRNFITDFFPDGQCILHMDDDIKYLTFMEEDLAVSDKKSAKRYPLYTLNGCEFQSWVEGAFSALALSSPPTKIFGIYPIRNGYFMKTLPYVSTNLRFCVGCVWGCINDKRIRVTLEEKEDYERTLICWKLFGSILRYNHIAPVTAYYITPGGMQTRGSNYRIQRARESCEFLIRNYPDLCVPGRTKKTTGIAEIRLRMH